MAYHDYGHYTTRWTSDKKETEKKESMPENPRVQVISPQKKLYDIQQIIDSLPDEYTTTVELSKAIQGILNGGSA